MWSIITQIHNLKRTQFNWVEPFFFFRTNRHQSLCVSTHSSNRQEVFAGCQQASVIWLITAPERQRSVPKTALRWTANPATTRQRATAMTASVPHTSSTVGGCSGQVTHTPLTGWADLWFRSHHQHRSDKLNLEIQALALASLSILANKTDCINLNFLLAGLVLSGKSGAKGNTWCCVTLEVFFCQAPLLD